jgi:hypothetical protein
VTLALGSVPLCPVPICRRSGMGYSYGESRAGSGEGTILMFPPRTSCVQQEGGHNEDDTRANESGRSGGGGGVTRRKGTNNL